MASATPALARFGFAPAEADVRVRTVYRTQIGSIAMQVREDAALRLSRILACVKTFCSERPTDRETARFHARIGASPAG